MHHLIVPALLILGICFLIYGHRKRRRSLLYEDSPNQYELFIGS